MTYVAGARKSTIIVGTRIGQQFIAGDHKLKIRFLCACATPRDLERRMHRRTRLGLSMSAPLLQTQSTSSTIMSSEFEYTQDPRATSS